jgi:hypothetical protein
VSDLTPSANAMMPRRTNQAWSTDFVVDQLSDGTRLPPGAHNRASSNGVNIAPLSLAVVMAFLRSPETKSSTVDSGRNK